MNATSRRIALWLTVGVTLAVALVFAFRPRAIAIDAVTVQQGELVVTVNEEGETRVRDVYVLSAPVTGRVLRIEAEAGDEVFANQTLIGEIEPGDASLLDVRGEAQAKADIHAAESARALAAASVEEALAELEFARADLDRAHKLILNSTISKRELDDAERIHKTRNAAYATTLAALQVRDFELERARAQLLSSAGSRTDHTDCDCVPIRSPVDGRVLRVYRDSERIVSAGDPLVDIGDPTNLEIVVDLLSVDAVRIASGMRVIIEQWGGDQNLDGHVRRVEPFGFTKVSALGIEEQRVNVIIDLISPQESWSRMGHGYQVGLRIVVWEKEDALKIPITSLFRVDDQWAVFKLVDGRAEVVDVTLGQQNSSEAEVLSGLAGGDRVVAYPSGRIQAGSRVSPRS